MFDHSVDTASAVSDNGSSTSPRWVSRLWFGILLVVVFLASTVIITAVLRPAQPVKAPAPAKVETAVATVDKSPALQAKRWRLIQDLIAQDVFQKVSMPATLPHLWVRPAFYALNFDTKQTFVSVVYAYYLDGSDVSEGVRIFDALSDKEVGDYSPEVGLNLHQ